MAFDIFEHIDSLEKVKGGKYRCPICNGHNLSISKNGAYRCWNGCEIKDIRDAINPPINVSERVELPKYRPILKTNSLPVDPKQIMLWIDSDYPDIFEIARDEGFYLCETDISLFPDDTDRLVGHLELSKWNCGAIAILAGTTDRARQFASDATRLALLAGFETYLIKAEDFWSDRPDEEPIGSGLLFGKWWASLNGKGKPQDLHKVFIEQQKKGWQPVEATDSNPANPVDPRPEIDQSDLLTLEIKTAILQERNPVKRSLEESRLCKQFGVSQSKLTNLIAYIGDAANARKAQVYSQVDFKQRGKQGGRWLFPGMLRRGGGTTFVVGDPGSGKTTIAYDVAYSVNTGTPFLYEPPTETGGCLFLSADESADDAQDRLYRRGHPDSVGNHLLVNWGLKDWDLLEETVRANKPLLVVVDSFNAIQDDVSFDENSAMAASPIKRFNRLSEEHNLAVIMIHHFAKGNNANGQREGRGSTALRASCTGWFNLEGEFGETQTFYTVKQRGSKRIKTTIQADPESGKFFILTTDGFDELTRRIANQLESFFVENLDKSYEYEEICDYLGGRAKENFFAINYLVQRGVITERRSAVSDKRVWRFVDF